MNPAWRKAGWLPPNWPCRGGGGGSVEGAVMHDDFDSVPQLQIDATLGQTTEKVREVIDKLKGVFILTLLVPLASYGGMLDPGTLFRDIPPYTPLSNMVSAAGVVTKGDLAAESNRVDSAMRRMVDMSVYEQEREHWVWIDAFTPDAPPDYTNCPPDLIEYLNSYGAKKPHLEHPSDTTWLWVIGSVETPVGKYDQSAIDSFPPDATNVVFTFNRKGDLNRFFRARAVRPSTNDTPVVASTDVRLATTHDVGTRVPAGDFVAATNDLWNAKGGGEGQARMLPPYLHFLEVADSYPEEAKWFYDQAYGPSACSSLRDGQFHYRNYDWDFDFSPVFVVSTLPGPGRLASIGIGGVGTNLTEDIVTSGEWNRWYKAVPGHMLDGINERGVCININVMSSHSHTNGWHGDPATDGIHCLAAVRWTLDNAINAAWAAEELARRVYVPQGALDKGYSFHYMVSDATSTWIVEDGWCSNFTGRVAMTNVRSLDSNDPCGTGRERLALLNAGGSITDAWYTKAYTDEGNKRLSEFIVTGTETTAELEAAWQTVHDYWVSKPREAHRGERLGGENWWQTVHTSVYDLSAKTVKVSVQETDDCYSFTVPVGGLSGFWIDESNMSNHILRVTKDLIKSKVESLTESSTAADIVNALKSIYE